MSGIVLGASNNTSNQCKALFSKNVHWSEGRDTQKNLTLEKRCLLVLERSLCLEGGKMVGRHQLGACWDILEKRW